MDRLARYAMAAVVLMCTLGIAHAQTAELLLVHLLPDRGEAQWLLDGEPIGTTDFHETEGYVLIPATEGTLTARIEGTEALSAALDPRDGFRYVAYLHEGPEGAPAVVSSTGHVGDVASGAMYLRAVNLVPDLSDVSAHAGEGCSGARLETRPYGLVNSPMPISAPFPGPSTLCAGGEKLVSLAAADEQENWHAAPNRVKSIVLYQRAGELAAILVDETPNVP